jgi:hypothetical protein
VIEKLRAFVHDFEACQTRWANHGAADTEPDAVFQWLVVKQLEQLSCGENVAVDVPASVSSWQLYDMKGSGNVARELCSKTRRVNAEIRKIVRVHGGPGWRAVVKWAQDYCWRCSIVVN